MGNLKYAVTELIFSSNGVSNIT